MAPGMLPMPPSTAAVKALMPGDEADQEEDLAEQQPVEDAGGAGHRRADRERHHDRAVDVDAHQRGGALSSDTARMAVPILVRMTKRYSAAIITTADADHEHVDPLRMPGSPGESVDLLLRKAMAG